MPKIKLNEPLRIELIQISSPDHYSLWNALSVETLAGHIRGVLGNEVTVRINRVQKSEDIASAIESIKDLQPHILGISPELGSLKWTERLIKQFRKLRFRNSGKPLLVLGNKLPTYFPIYFLSEYPEAIIVKGEGEEAIIGLIEYVRKQRSLFSIPNLAFKIKNNRIHQNDERTPDLENLMHPPSTDTVTAVSKECNVLVQASRGCSWSLCTYCTIHGFRKGRKWDGFPLDRVFANLERLVAMGVSEFEFADDDFLGLGGVDEDNRIDRAYRIADCFESLRKKSGRKITFRIFMMPHEVYLKGKNKRNAQVKKLLFRLKKVGLIRVYFGVESGCISQLKRYHRFHEGDRVHGREYSIKELEETMRFFREDIKIKTDVGFIMFDPFLRLDELLENIQFFRDWNLITNNQWPFRPIAVNEKTILYGQLKAWEKHHPGKPLIGDLDLELMCYEYDFEDQRVQKINDEILRLSNQTKDFFYALKVISKQQFCQKKQTSDTRRAHWYAKRNGMIYLTMMKSMAKSFIRHTEKKRFPIIIERAKTKIANLLQDCRTDIKKGLFKKHRKRLLKHMRIK